MKLFLGHAVEIQDAGKMFIPTLNEVAKIGESSYMQYLNILLINKDSLKGNIDLDSFSIIYQLCKDSYEFMNEFDKAIRLIFRKSLSAMNEDFFVLGNPKHKKIIHRDNLPIIQHILRVANMISDQNEDEYKPANERARRFIERMKKRKAKKPIPKKTISLHSMMSGIAWKENGISILDIGKLTIYQLYDAYKRIENIDNYNTHLSGLSFGTVDGKKLNMSEINWARVIN